MLEIDGKYYFTDVEHVLDKLRLKIFNVSGDNFMLCCPFHKDHKPSFGIHRDTGVFNCFACGVKGDFIHFVSKVLDTNRDIGEEFLSTVSSKERIAPKISVPEKRLHNTNYDYQRYIDYVGYKYFHNRNISRKIVDMFDIGTEKDYLVFPIKDISGNVLAVQKRHLTTKKFMFPTGFNVKDYIFGLPELMKYGNTSKPVIVCESVIDCMTVWEYGGQAIALYSAMPSDAQFKLLVRSPFRIFKDGFDMDEAGRIGWNLFKKYGVQKGLRVVESKDHGKKDINDLSYQEFLKWGD